VARFSNASSSHRCTEVSDPLRRFVQAMMQERALPNQKVLGHRDLRRGDALWWTDTMYGGSHP